MTIEELFNKLRKVDGNFTVELTSPHVYEINYCGDAFIEINLNDDEPMCEFEIDGFGFYEADIIIGAVKVIKEFMENYDN